MIQADLTSLPSQIISSGCLETFLIGSDGPYMQPTFPLAQIKQDFPFTIVGVAAGDNLVPPQHSYALSAKLTSLGVRGSFVEFPGMQHGEIECLPGIHAWSTDCTWWEDQIRPTLYRLIAEIKARP